MGRCRLRRPRTHLHLRRGSQHESRDGISKSESLRANRVSSLRSYERPIHQYGAGDVVPGKLRSRDLSEMKVRALNSSAWKPLLALVGVAALAAAAAWFVLPLGGYAPTCVTFDFSASNSDPAALDAFVSEIIAKSKLTPTGHSAPGSRRGIDKDLFVKWDGAIRDGSKLQSSLIWCRQKGGDSARWLEKIKETEGELARRFQIERVLLQRGQDHRCDSDRSFFPCKNPCTQTLTTPMDISELRTLGVIGK